MASRQLSRPSLKRSSFVAMTRCVARAICSPAAVLHVKVKFAETQWTSVQPDLVLHPDAADMQLPYVGLNVESSKRIHATTRKVCPEVDASAVLISLSTSWCPSSTPRDRIYQYSNGEHSHKCRLHVDEYENIKFGMFRFEKVITCGMQSLKLWTWSCL